MLRYLCCCVTYFVPFSRLSMTQKSFRFSGPRAWNFLPSNLRDAPSRTAFANRLKTHLFKLAYSWIVYNTVGFFVSSAEPRRGAPSKYRLIDWLIDWLIDLLGSVSSGPLLTAGGSAACKLTQRGLGRNPNRQRFLCIFDKKKVSVWSRKKPWWSVRNQSRRWWRYGISVSSSTGSWQWRLTWAIRGCIVSTPPTSQRQAVADPRQPARTCHSICC